MTGRCNLRFVSTFMLEKSFSCTSYAFLIFCWFFHVIENPKKNLNNKLLSNFTTFKFHISNINAKLGILCWPLFSHGIRRTKALGLAVASSLFSLCKIVESTIRFCPSDPSLPHYGFYKAPCKLEREHKCYTPTTITDNPSPLVRISEFHRL